MSLDVFSQLKNHFRLLGLADRYRRMALEHMGGQWRALTRVYGVAEDAQRVANELNVKAEDFKEQYGDNYWLAVLYRALAANVEFCDGGFEVLRT